MKFLSGKKMPAFLIPVCDIVAAGLCLLVFAYFHHVRPSAGENDITKLPQSVIPQGNAYAQYGSETDSPDETDDFSVTTADGDYTVTTAPSESDSDSETETGAITDAPEDTSKGGTSETEPPRNTDAPASSETTPAQTEPPYDLSGWGYKWPEKFSIDNKVTATDTSYKSHNLNVTIKKYEENGMTYYVQDIYMRYIDNLKTAFAQDTYGRAYLENQQTMSSSHNAICSINADYYANRESGVLIRNYVCYRDVPKGDVCALYYDGTMKNFTKSEFDTETELNNGVYQTFTFGPALITNGTRNSGFSGYVAGVHPRSGIGYFEPGHYCFVLVDGRQDGYSVGATLDEFALIFEKLGCKQAYNLDGGQSSMMFYRSELVNQPYEGGRKTSDIVYICD